MRLAHFFVLFVLMWFAEQAIAQELEPRKYANTPTDVNVIGLGYAWSNGNVLLDPALSIEDLDADLHLIFANYLYSFGLFGKNAKFRALLPATTGRWEGTVNGIQGSRRDQGIGDAWVSLEWNFAGAPALERKGMSTYRPQWVFGTSVLVSIPVGSYDKDELLNLGTNRWSLRTELAAARTFGRWTIEGVAGVRVFTDNDKLLGDNTLKQDPFYTLKGAVIYSFKQPGMWLAAAYGWGVGGQTAVNGISRQTEQRNIRLGTTFAFPFSRRHGGAITYVTGLAKGAGSDYDTLAFSYHYAWGKGMAQADR